MPNGSIAARLFMLSALWLVIALAATAFLLSELYSRALDRSLVETLNFNIETLVARTLEAGNAESEAVTAADPRFQRPASGWYWQITGPDGELFNLSGSLVGSPMPTTNVQFDALRTRTAVLRDDFSTEVKLIERVVTTAGAELVYSVTGNLDEINEQTATFRGQALVVLIAVGAMLAIMSAIVARVAMRPVGRLRAEMEQVREGERGEISGAYPRELTPLADELNELLRSNADIVQRAKSHVGNLAHGLKTPLAVLRNEAATTKTAFANTVTSEVERMSGMVTNYLDRAQLAARTSLVGQRADAAIVVSRLVRVMDKLHPDKSVSFQPAEGANIWFRGEADDLEEMVGNLLDNGCKWAASEVKISMGQPQGTAETGLIITIEDDGPGLTEDERTSVLQRGVRLDEKVPGSGLGLDIVKELVDVYGGKLDLSRSTLGGLQAELTLPTAKNPH